MGEPAGGGGREETTTGGWRSFYRVSLFAFALLEPAELGERQFGGDGSGQGQLVVGACRPLQFESCSTKFVSALPK